VADDSQRNKLEPEGQSGQAGPGELYDPTNPQDEQGSEAPEGGAPRPSPGPNVPVPAEEYERLKRNAKHKSLPPSPQAQEDRRRKE
jgi:hypothetical protein